MRGERSGGGGGGQGTGGGGWGGGKGAWQAPGGLCGEPQPSEYPRPTDSFHCLPVFTNQIEDQVLSQPNEVWVSDLTYLRTAEGFLYLALVTDKYSRKIVGYHCGDTLEAAGCLCALDMALAELPEGVWPMHHSDRGSQY